MDNLRSEFNNAKLEENNFMFCMSRVRSLQTTLLPQLRHSGENAQALATQTNVVDRSRTAIECMRKKLIQPQAEIDRSMSNVFENRTELNSAKGTTKLEGQIQDMQEAHFAIWSNPDEASHSSGVGANPQTGKLAQYLDKTFLLCRRVKLVLGGTYLEFLDARMFTPHL